MALVKSWAELKRRRATEPAAEVSVAALLAVARSAKAAVDGAEHLPRAADDEILDLIAKAGAGAFYRAHARAVAAGVRAVIRLVAEREAERTRRQVLNRLSRHANAGRAGANGTGGKGGETKPEVPRVKR
jgi:hypothetical protein